MEIKIETEVLVKNGLCADDFILLYSIYHGVETGLTYKLESISNLERLALIKQMPDNSITLRQKALNLFQVKDLEQSFLEFFGAFPLKVPSRDGGSRPLRAKNSDAQSVKSLRKKYQDIIKNNPELHEHILKVLDAEKEMKRKSNSLQFMHNIDTWINQKDWEKFEYLLDEDSKEIEKVTGI